MLNKEEFIRIVKHNTDDFVSKESVNRNFNYFVGVAYEVFKNELTHTIANLKKEVGSLQKELDRKRKFNCKLS